MPAHQPVPTRSVRDAYDAVAAAYAAHLPDTRAETSLDLAMVAAFADAVRADGLVLDAGCGAGRMSRHLTSLGCDVTGVDLSPGMVAEARRAAPEVPVTVGSLGDLPFADGRFAGVLLWYSTIHTPPGDQPLTWAEVARVLRPGGHVLVGFQSGTGTRDVAEAYRRHGLEVELVRHLQTAEEVAAHAARVGLREVARLVRRGEGSERDDQASLLLRSDPRADEMLYSS
ncbi:MAG: class I SAM-dependent methyltransferase [Nocardioides sp.]